MYIHEITRIDGEPYGAADTGPERQEDGVLQPLGRPEADLSQQRGVGVVDDGDFARVAEQLAPVQIL